MSLSEKKKPSVEYNWLSENCGLKVSNICLGTLTFGTAPKVGITRPTNRLSMFDTLCSVPRGSHTKPIFSSLRLLNLEQILTLQTSIFMFRYEHKLLPLCFQGYFHLASDIHTHYTRGSNSYRSISARTNTRLFSIKCVGPKIWNMLPARIRLAPHLRKFKKELHKYLIDGN